ncbi:L-lactate dehydrogenase [Devriesea agamarum]|uniref:L-lactate dehydrogenase n=1 Tax=Devriesea agamarum TaxID=472569 RepID=UPI00071DF852|nr:L-lactate dehydrogenase [Devriesea agamarum]
MQITPEKSTKLAVIGAGSVGSSLAYASLIRGAARTVALYDLNTAKVNAEVLDLAHGTQFMSGSRVIGGDDIECVHDADVVVITAGARQKPGQSRLDLAGANVAILRSLMPQLLEQAPDAIYVLVTNPCDVLTAAAVKISGLPPSRVMSSGTVLDSSRLRWLIGTRIGVAPSSVHAMIVGEHGDSEFGLWSSASIGQVPLTQWTDENGEQVFTPEALEELGHKVSGAAYRVIEGKGATNYAIGVTGTRIVQAILGDQHAVLPVSTVLDDYHGVSGVAMSVPSIVSRDGVVRTLDFPMDDAEHARFIRSAETLREVHRQLGI